MRIFHLILKSRIVLTVCAVFLIGVLLSGCSKNDKVRFDETTDLSYEDVDLGGRIIYGHVWEDIESQISMPPLCIVDDGGNKSLMLVNCEDGSRGIVQADILDKNYDSKGKVYNYNYRHFASETPEEIIGLSLDELTSRWGDYVFAVKRFDSPSMEGDKYSFPNIMLLDDGAYLDGVTVYVDPTGKVLELEPLRERHRNLFGSLPFYDSILRLNLMEWVMPGPMVDSVGDAPSRGFWKSLFLCLIYFAVLIALPFGIAYLLLYAVDRIWDYKSENVTRILTFILVPLLLICEYIVIISLLDYYSAAWWITSLLMFGWAIGIPFLIIGGKRDYCPKCKDTFWTEDKRITKVEYDKPLFKQVWDPVWNTPKPVLGRKEDPVKITYEVRKRCCNCGYVKTSTTTEDTYLKRNLCPRCFEETVRNWFGEPEISGGRIRVDFFEECTNPGCGYKCTTDVKGPAITGPQRRQAPSSGRANDPNSMEPGETRCSHLRYANGSYRCMADSGYNTCPFDNEGWGYDNEGHRRKCKLYATRYRCS